ncbi:MAG: alanine dehydrogenase [Desulfotalea sp.]|nr:MAG: alanine dehydrogenase [Desulfotalea sp.]
MKKTKIGLIREGKVPVDRRVALPPGHAQKVLEKYPNVEIVAEQSDIRCFSDQDYEDSGIKIVKTLDDCDVIFGVKEVPIPSLITEKTYFFFSHTIKKQAYNRDLLQEILQKKIRLIDYETLTAKNGSRIIAFGRWAGIVGAYNGILTYGKRYNLFELKRANDCFDIEDLKNEFSRVTLPPVKIILTGGGRVAKGAIEVLIGMGIRKVTPSQFLEQHFDFPVFCQLNVRNYNKKADGTDFSRNEFYKEPQRYDGDFLKYTQHADILIASAFWAPQAPVLFDRKDMLRDDFKINVIADITCDIEGSIPSTKQPSTIADPIYDYNPCDDLVENPFSDEGNITVMAVDNLPCELARDASMSFGDELVANVLPAFLGKDEDEIIKRATIAEQGKLTDKFNYLQDYVDGN